MNKNSTETIRNLVNDNTTYARVDPTGDIYYEPFIEDGKVGFYVRDHHGREDCVYLEPCDNEPLVWVHHHNPSEALDPERFFMLCHDWPEEGWQVTLEGSPKGAVHTDPTEAEGHRAALQKIHPDKETDVVSVPFNKE